MARAYERSVEQARRTLEMAPEFTPARHVLGIALEQKGQYEDAEAAFAQARAGSEDNVTALASLGHLLALTRREEEAEGILLQLEDRAAGGYVSPYHLAILNTGLGRIEEALRRLESACAQRDLWMVWLQTEPRFDRLRGEPRFDGILRRLGFASRGHYAAR
jgi:Flp pilus assembly protein TadD